MENNEAEKRILDAWLPPLRDIGVRRNVIECIGATGHVPFDQAQKGAWSGDVHRRLHTWKTRLSKALAKVPEELLSLEERLLKSELARLRIGDPLAPT